MTHALQGRRDGKCTDLSLQAAAFYCCAVSLPCELPCRPSQVCCYTVTSSAPILKPDFQGQGVWFWTVRRTGGRFTGERWPIDLVLAVFIVIAWLERLFFLQTTAWSFLWKKGKDYFYWNRLNVNIQKISIYLFIYSKNLFIGSFTAIAKSTKKYI